MTTALVSYTSPVWLQLAFQTFQTIKIAVRTALHTLPCSCRITVTSTSMINPNKHH